MGESNTANKHSAINDGSLPQPHCNTVRETHTQKNGPTPDLPAPEYPSPPRTCHAPGHVVLVPDLRGTLELGPRSRRAPASESGAEAGAAPVDTAAGAL